MISDKVKKALDDITLEDVVEAGPRGSFSRVQMIINGSIDKLDKLSDDMSLPAYVNNDLIDTCADLLFVSRVLSHMNTILTGKCKQVQFDSREDKCAKG